MDLVSKPRSKSIVWMYFGLKADEKGQPLNSGEAICRLCRKIVLAKGGNTTNLRSHLKRRHRADFFESTTSSTTHASLFESPGKCLHISLHDFCEVHLYLEPPCLQLQPLHAHTPIMFKRSLQKVARKRGAFACSLFVTVNHSCRPQNT